MTPRYQGSAYRSGEVIAQLETIEVVRDASGAIFAYVESWRAYTSANTDNLRQFVSEEEFQQMLAIWGLLE